MFIEAMLTHAEGGGGLSFPECSILKDLFILLAILTCFGIAFSRRSHTEICKRRIILGEKPIFKYPYPRFMQRLKRIVIENYRSIGEEPVTITFPQSGPTILIGENNCGKTNIVRVIELLFGEYHPKYKKLDNFDHFERNEATKISIDAEVSGFQTRFGRGQAFTCSGFSFTAVKGRDNTFQAIQSEDGQANEYVPNTLREELVCVVVNAEQNLTYQLSYSSKFTLLSKVTKAFHDKLIEDEDRVNKLKEIFENIRSTFLEVDEFAAFNKGMSSIAGQMLSNMSHALQFDFSAYDPSNYFKTLRIQPVDQGEVRAFEELGTGQQQVLAMAFAYAYAKAFMNQGLLFVLDEPEAHLHPLAQKWLAKRMYQMAADGLQLIVTTHSPYFIDLEFLDGLHLVSKENQTKVTHVSADQLATFCGKTGAVKAEPSSILSFYAAHSKAHILTGFFAKKIVLVEGETEELALPIYLQKLGLDTLKEGIAIIGVSGKGNLAKWWRLFQAYSIPTFICFDNDTADDRKGEKRRDALISMGLAGPDIEAMLCEDSWNVNHQFCVFGKDFETTMRASFDCYAEIEAEEQLRLGSSKPIVARAVAERLATNDFDRSDIGWEHLKGLKEWLLIFEIF